MQGAIYPSLKERTVLVTGGGSGIGEAIVRQFVGQGSRVGFIDVDVKASNLLLSSLPGEAKAHFEHADLRDIGALRRAVAAIREALGPITILVNNAARDDRHSIEDVTPEYWDERIAVNLKHQFFAAQAVAPDMTQAGGGAIVNTATTGVLHVVPHMAAFTAFKHGIVGLTKSVARDYAGRNIRANVLCPGATATPMLLGWLPKLGMTPETMGSGIPMGRMARPEEQAEAAVWLCSPRSSYVTGVVMPVDGGAVL